jgi:hypothetical protein
VSKTRYVRSGDLRIAYELRGLAVSRQPALLLIQGLGLDRAGWGRPSGRCSAGSGWCWSTTGAAAAAALRARLASPTWQVTRWPCSTTPGSARRTCRAQAWVA